jgi:hypothetical protein
MAGGRYIASTESTIEGVSFSARALLSLVEREVRATQRRSSLSTSRSSLKESRNCPLVRHFRHEGWKCQHTLRASVLASS